MIIYTQTKDVTCKVFSYLRRFAPQKHWVGLYHASLTETTKLFMQHQFHNNESQLRCLVATVAFGMVCPACYLLNSLRIGISVTLFFIGYGHPGYWISCCLWDTRYSGPVLPGVLWTMWIGHTWIDPFTTICYCVALWPCWSKWATVKSALVSLETAEIQRWVTAVILQRKRELSSNNSCAWDWELRVTAAEWLLLWRMHVVTVSTY